MQKAKKRRALHDFMTPTFWRTHHIIPAFIALLGLGMALGIAHFSSFQPYKALATSSENVLGWAWAPNVGWFSLNDVNAAACKPATTCGTYGLNVALTSGPQPDGRQGHKLDGFAWSDNVGFVCFGESCENPACKPSYFPPTAPGKLYYAYVEPIVDDSPKKVSGWAIICNQKDAGLISLNCEDVGSCKNPPNPDLNYRVVFNPADKKFFVSSYESQPAMSQGVSFGWNGNALNGVPDGTGIGYISFYPEWVGGGGFADGMHLKNLVEDCNVVGDEDLNGFADCADDACKALPKCQAEICNGLDDNVNALTDETFECPMNASVTCNVCGTGGTRQCTASCTWAGACVPPAEICNDGIDNNCDSLIDAADPTCVSNQPECTDGDCGLIADPAKRAECCCNDNSGNPDGVHAVDCLDSLCVDQAPKVCSAWSKVQTGNIYAGGGITGTQAPKAAGTSNVTYCLRSTGEIDWTSNMDCQEKVTNEPLLLPTYQTGYRNKLGFLDLQGIRTGRYGEVVTLKAGDTLPDTLGGKVYRYADGGTFTLTSKTFLNGSILTVNRGNGLLFIDGGSLDITDDVTYSSEAVTGGLRNLASFGVIVVKDATRAGGNIDIEPNVTTFSGTLFAEGIITTKSSMPSDIDENLKLYGILVANQFKLLRDNGPSTTPAEEVIFDGRAVANPPPGMQDISRSLPRADFNY